MSIRNLAAAIGVCLAASVAAFGQAGSGYVFQLPGQTSTSGQIYGYPYAGNPLTVSINTLGPNGTSQIVPKPDGTGYYVVGTTLQIANSAFTTFTTINGIASAPTALVASPDGNYAIVGAGDVYILSASTGAILLDTNTGGSVVAIAVSEDSTTAYVLTNTFTASNVTQINLVTRTKGATLTFQYGGASAIGISPFGLVYAAGVNRVYEIDPVAFAVTTNGTIGLNATPGPLHFTPDGTTLYFANTTANITGPSLYQVTLATHTATQYPTVVTSTPPLLSDVLVAGNGRVFGISTSATTLYDVSTAPLSLSISTSIGTLNSQAQNVVAAAISDELPSALYLYLEIAGSGTNSLYRVALGNNQAGTQAASAGSSNILQFVGVPPNTGAANFLTLNNDQTVAQGATSLPLIAQVLDITGRPIFDQPVSFTVANSSGVVINTPTPTTNANGWVETTIVAPATEGTYTVTLTAGIANTSFTINVPGKGGASGGGQGGVTQVFINTGNGQLVGAGTTTFLDPLTVLVTDVAGAPLAGVSVSFSVTSGTGICSGTFTTDDTGLAAAIFLATAPADNLPFEVDTVVASTPYGPVTFYEIEYPTTIGGSSASTFSSPPQVLLVTQPNSTISVPEGGVVQNAVTASVTVAPGLAGALTPIQDVAMRIVEPNTLTASPYASCQGAPLSDQTGHVSCSVVGSCGAALGVPQAIQFEVGDQQGFGGFITVTQGTAQMLSIVAGNNQAGNAGQALPTPLLVSVTDTCGNPIAGAKVSWVITEGVATLSSATGITNSNGTVSDTVTLGATPGTVQVTASFGALAPVTFALTSQAVASVMTIVGGNNQTATVGTAFAQPLAVQITDANNNPIPGLTVTFAVASGNVVLSLTSVVTNSQGEASTNATATQTPGSIAINASYGSVSTSFALTAIPVGPQVTATSFQNAASFIPGIVPCGLATATGSNLAPGITGTVSGASFFGPLQYTLNGLSLTVNGTPAPIYQLSNTNGKQQVTFQTPCQAAPGSGTVQITLSGAAATVQGVQILAAQPGIFNYADANGNPDGYLISADDASIVSASNPAKRGHNYYMIATGLGPVTPATSTDSPGVNGQNVVNQVIVGVSNSGVPVLSAYYQPGEIGIYAVEFTIPANLTLTNSTGTNQPLALAVVVNGQTIFGNPVFIPAVQ